VAHLLGTTAQSVLRWVCRSVDRFCTKPPPGEAVVIELDEMCHFLQRKDNKVWIWKAFDRATGRLVDWECGARDERTFRRLFERLARWKVRLFCSDNYVFYPLVLAVGSHFQGKGQTVALERNNGQQRVAIRGELFECAKLAHARCQRPRATAGKAHADIAGRGRRRSIELSDGEGHRSRRGLGRKDASHHVPLSLARVRGLNIQLIKR